VLFCYVKGWGIAFLWCLCYNVHNPFDTTLEVILGTIKTGILSEEALAAIGKVETLGLTPKPETPPAQIHENK